MTNSDQPWSAEDAAIAAGQKRAEDFEKHGGEPSGFRVNEQFQLPAKGCVVLMAVLILGGLFLLLRPDELARDYAARLAAFERTMADEFTGPLTLPEMIAELKDRRIEISEGCDAFKRERIADVTATIKRLREQL